MKAIQCRMARAATGMGVRDLADKAGVAVSSVSRFEAGGNTTVTNLDKMKSDAQIRKIILFLVNEEALLLLH